MVIVDLKDLRPGILIEFRLDIKPYIYTSMSAYHLQLNADLEAWGEAVVVRRTSEFPIRYAMVIHKLPGVHDSMRGRIEYRVVGMLTREQLLTHSDPSVRELVDALYDA